MALEWAFLSRAYNSISRIFQVLSLAYKVQSGVASCYLLIQLLLPHSCPSSCTNPWLVFQHVSGPLYSLFLLIRTKVPHINGVYYLLDRPQLECRWIRRAFPEHPCKIALHPPTFILSSCFIPFITFTIIWHYYKFISQTVVCLIPWESKHT